MSIPISGCLVSKAAHGNEKAYARLVEAMRYNLKCGHFSMGGCDCKPPCPKPTEDQIDNLNTRLAKDMFETAKKAEKAHRKSIAAEIAAHEKLDAKFNKPIHFPVKGFKG